MSPTNPHVVSQLRQLTYYHLDNSLLRNALFFAGRLQAYEPKSQEAAYLLALCHFRLGSLNSAYDSSRTAGLRGTHLGCAYIFAQACLGLEKYLEGLSALDRSKGLWSGRNSWNKHTESRRPHLPDAAAVHCLQGKLWQGHRDTDKAILSYAEALKLNPFMWDAFLSLCDMGVHVRISNIFKMTPEMERALYVATVDENKLETLNESVHTNALSQSQSANHLNANQPTNNDPFSISKNRINGEVRPSLAIFDKFNLNKTAITPISGGDLELQAFDTPTGVGNSFTAGVFPGKEAPTNHTVNGNAAEPPLAPIRKSRPAAGLGTDLVADAPPKMRSHSIKSKSRSIDESRETDPVAGRPPSVAAGVGDRKRTISGQAAPVSSTTTTTSSTSIVNSNDPMAPQRRSVRLINQFRPQSGKFSVSGSLGSKEGRELKKAKATGTKGRSAGNAVNPNVGRVVSGNRVHGDPMDHDAKEQRKPSTSSAAGPERIQKPTSTDMTKETEGLKWLFELLIKLGTGYFAQSHYRCQEAYQIYNMVATSQRETPWVLSQMGRALFDQTAYADAGKIYARLKAIEPSRLEDMEVYSVCLWHQRNDVDLAYLAHEIVDINRNSPQAWCAVGNSFSVQKDHEQAVKCFKRATQLDPKFAYAYTLQGHEHIENEEYDKALAAFRTAVAVEERQFNGWYGLGRVFEKQGKYDFAERHYRTAASINPNNPVLICCIGHVLEKMKNPRAALIQYTRACEIAPKVPMSRFKRAKILYGLGEPDQALEELQHLKNIAPDEANVHFWLGKVHNALGHRQEAVKEYTSSMTLDPKSSQFIKDILETLGEEVEDEDTHHME